MAVKIRLKRIGAKKNPFYRIVVADARYPRDGRFIEQIGTYDPMTNPAKVTVDGGRALEWMKNGAQPTDTVRSLLKTSGALEKARSEAAAAAVAAEAEAAGDAGAAGGAVETGAAAGEAANEAAGEAEGEAEGGAEGGAAGEAAE